MSEPLSLEGIAPAIRSDPHPGFVRFVLHGLYDLCWILAAIVGLPWLLWRSWTRPGFGGMVLGRLGRRLEDEPLGSDERPRVLVHGVSVGEIKGAISVVRELERRRPDLAVVISVSTETGYLVARSLFPDHPVVHFPVDLSFVVSRFLRRVRPAAVVLVELEIWPNFLRCANRRGIPVAVVNGRITAQSFRSYRVFKGLLPQFDRISLYCAQGPEYSRRFLALRVDPDRVMETGNVKADGLDIGRVEPGVELRRLLGSVGPVLVGGSTHGEEERWLTEAWRESLPDWRLVLVPRHPKRLAEVLAHQKELGIVPQLLSELRAGATPDPARPAIVDTIGELEQVYGLADLVFVGGSLVPHGGQNMLEPASQGIAVLTGPHLDNFTQEARLLDEAGALEVLQGVAGLAPALARLGRDVDARLTMGAAGMHAVRAQQGAAAKTLDALQATCLPDR
ncbi:MAG: glycosyltransferase N-terminal domain-containing protein [Planctomycetota bacterium]|nr:glycosyltransferase N-terminal domain-containing protein [Planctomycetota bacterium]